MVIEHTLEGIGLKRAGAINACQLVFANHISDSEDTMLFHVMAQHYWDTCDGAKRAKGDPGVAPRVDTQRWVEGNDKVKVLSAIGHQTLTGEIARVLGGDGYGQVCDLFRFAPPGHRVTVAGRVHLGARFSGGLRSARTDAVCGDVVFPVFPGYSPG